jgi:hypothetical protein
MSKQILRWKHQGNNLVQVHLNSERVQHNTRHDLKQVEAKIVIQKCDMCKRTDREPVKARTHLWSIWGKNGFDVFKHLRNWFCGINLTK